MNLPRLRAYARLSGARRREVAALLRQQYDAGHSVRDLARSTGYSYGRVYGLLVSAGVTFRRRGAGPHGKGGPR